RGDLNRYKMLFRLAHAERLPPGGPAVPWPRLPLYPASPTALASLLDSTPYARQLGKPERIHLLLAAYPLVKLDLAYRVVYEKIVGETVSTTPVSAASAAAPAGRHPAGSGSGPAVHWQSSSDSSGFDLNLASLTSYVPSPEERRQQARAEELAHARDNPPVTEVLAGSTLNFLLKNAESLQREGMEGPDVPLDRELLARINV